TKLAPEQEAINFIEEYDRAWNHKDAAAVERVLAPGYIYFSSKGQVEFRRQVLDMLRSPKYTLSSAERREVTAYVMAGTAVLSSRWKGHGFYDGKEFRDDQRCSVVLVRAGQGWQVMSEHCTQIVTP